MYSICVSLPPDPPKLLLSTFLLAYFPCSLFCPPVPASTHVITATALR